MAAVSNPEANSNPAVAQALAHGDDEGDDEALSRIAALDRMRLMDAQLRVIIICGVVMALMFFRPPNYLTLLTKLVVWGFPVVVALCLFRAAWRRIEFFFGNPGRRDDLMLAGLIRWDTVPRQIKPVVRFTIVVAATFASFFVLLSALTAPNHGEFFVLLLAGSLWMLLWLAVVGAAAVLATVLAVRLLWTGTDCGRSRSAFRAVEGATIAAPLVAVGLLGTLPSVLLCLCAFFGLAMAASRQWTRLLDVMEHPPE